MVVLRRFGLVAVVGVVTATLSGCGFDLLREDDMIVFRNDSQGLVYWLIESGGGTVIDLEVDAESILDLNPPPDGCWDGPIRVLDVNRDEIARIDGELCAKNELILHEDLTLTKSEHW